MGVLKDNSSPNVFTLERKIIKERVKIKRECEDKIEREREEAKTKLFNLESQIFSLQKEKRKSEENEKTLRSQNHSYKNEKRALLAELTRTKELKGEFQSELKASRQENVEKER